MIFVLNDFYLRQHDLLDEVVGKAIESWKSRKGMWLEAKDFGRTFSELTLSRRRAFLLICPCFSEIPAYEVDFHESLLAWRTAEKLAQQEDGLNLVFYQDQTDKENNMSADLPTMYLKTILETTCNFSDEYKLGQGGFGSVYKVMN